ncbi:hypothetical protein G4B88_023710 [Cannabis sativa]|uniref:Uncharacterized protein n=1 Tax=Cannabis sativa TaxID=3483 RepID=A0A7J6HV85_CANSA|nr:hypothetical protein G4B88_023710 [Cannabis sativa]
MDAIDAGSIGHEIIHESVIRGMDTKSYQTNDIDMMNCSNCRNFIDEILSISFGFTQYLHRNKTTTTKLSFEHRAITSFT